MHKQLNGFENIDTAKLIIILENGIDLAGLTKLSYKNMANLEQNSDEFQCHGGYGLLLLFLVVQEVI